MLGFRFNIRRGTRLGMTTERAQPSMRRIERRRTAPTRSLRDAGIVEKCGESGGESGGEKWSGRRYF